MTVARIVHDTGRAMGVSEKVMLAGFEAALVESNLNNCANGHLDSLGVFQQRASWGTVEQRTTVGYAATSFFARAKGIEGRYPTAGQLAQAVQVSAFPDRYDARQAQALSIIGQFGGNPFGYLDTASSPGPGYVRVSGWAMDPDAKTSPIDVHVYANTSGFNIGRADKLREDVGRAYPGYGNYHGYDAQVALDTGGTYTVCAYGINVGAGGNDRLKDCRPVTVADPRPFGYLDGVTSPQPETIRVRGWAVDPNSSTSPIDVHVYVGETGHAIGKAGVARPDVGKALPGYGNNHGYDTTVPAPVGTHKVCAYGINVGPGSNQQLKECKTVTVARRPATTQPTTGSAPTSPDTPQPLAEPADTPEPPSAGSPVQRMRLKVRRVTKRKVRISWESVTGTDRYFVSFGLLHGGRVLRDTRRTHVRRTVTPGKRYRVSVEATRTLEDGLHTDTLGWGFRTIRARG